MYVLIDLVWKAVEEFYGIDYPPWQDSYITTKQFYVLENLATGKLREVEQSQYVALKREGLIRDV